MSRRVVLKHPELVPPQKLVHFYDGFTVASNGVVDDTLEDWQIESVWRQGYKLTPDGTRLFDANELWSYIDDLNQPSEDKVEQEGIDSGGQSPDTNRVRKSQPKGRQDIPA